MKHIFSIIILSIMFSMVSYAGQWMQDDVGYRYMEDDGTYKTGWHQDADGKWYYLDNDSGYMLKDTITPDGYHVDASGVWKENQVSLNTISEYDNHIELIVAAYDDSPGGVRKLGYSMPTTVYYNNEYQNVYSGKIKVSRVEISKDGAPYLILSGDTKDVYKLSAKCKYTLSDGTFIEENNKINLWGDESGEDIFYPLLTTIGGVSRNQVFVSAEVWITEYVPENE